MDLKKIPRNAGILTKVGATFRLGKTLENLGFRTGICWTLIKLKFKVGNGTQGTKVLV